MAKYRKKPVVIEAMQWGTEAGDRGVYVWMEPGLEPHGMPTISTGQCSLRQIATNDFRLLIPTLEGVVEASPGDWIIKGVADEYYPCKPDIFEATYEEVK